MLIKTKMLHVQLVFVKCGRVGCVVSGGSRWASEAPTIEEKTQREEISGGHPPDRRSYRIDRPLQKTATPPAFLNFWTMYDRW